MMKTKRNIFRKRSSSEEGPSNLEKEIREVSRTTTSIFEKFTSRRKSTQEEGIVCKREDLLSIIKPKVEVPDSVTKRIPLRHIRSATIDSSTVQQSDILPFGPNASKKRSKSKNTAFQRSLSDETRTDGESLKRETLKKKVSEEDQTIEEKKRKQSLDEKQMMNQINNKEGESDGEHATVVWDDGNVLNAMLLGDAIESFLKGSMSNDEETEKRVSFRKS
ncbi:uncharacterized protein LOC143234712 [Tachypleus tridentatus]|uniref:uncharacterized protein LOC143234712 n=1 Tax=Tachypleus tridentatus TaxID=6853 RepID=UPI003FD12388